MTRGANTSSVLRVGPTAVLILLGAVGPWATDMYLSAMPDMQQELGTTASAVQLTLTTFLVGTAVGQLLLGSISDGLGRRRLLLAGTTVFTVMSALCALAPNVQVLNAARVVEGLAGAAGIVLSKAVVSDVSGGVTAARRYAVLGALGGLAPVLAPLTGNAVLGFGTWRAVFVVLTVLGLVMSAGTLLLIPETLPPERRGGTTLGDNLSRMRDLLSQRQFAAYVVIGCLSTGSLLTYVSGSSFVLRSVYGITQHEYSLVFSVNAVGIMASTALFGLLVARFRPRQLLIGGLSWSATGVVSLEAASLLTAGHPPFLLVWSCLFVQTSGMGMLTTATLTLGQEIAVGSGGTASALIGGSRMLAGAAFTPVTGLLGTDSVAPMAGVMSALLLSAVATFVWSVRAARTR